MSDRASLLPSRNLAVRLGLVLALTAGAVTLLQSALVGIVTRRQIEADSSGHLAELSEHMTVAMERAIFERIGDLQILAAIGPLQDPSSTQAERRATLETAMGANPSYTWLGIADPSGAVVVGTGRELEGESLAERAWFAEARAGRIAGDIAAPLQASLGAPTLELAVPLTAADGAVDGVLAARLSWRWAHELQRAFSASDGHAGPVEALVVDDGGRVILGPAGLVGQTLALPSIEAARRGEAGARTEVWPDGETHLVGFQQSRGLEQYPGLGWAVLVRQPRPAAFAAADRLPQQLMGGLLTLTALLIAVTALLIGRSTRPLRQIAAAADGLHSGTQQLTLPLVPGEDEVARLAQSLRRLVNSLLGQEQHLAATNASLRQELAARRFAEEEARRQTARTETLARIATKLNTHLELPAVLQTVCEETAAALGVQTAFVWLAHQEGGRLELAAAVGLPATGATPPTPPDLEQLGEDRDATMRALDEAFCFAAPAPAVLAAPLKRGGRVIGVLHSPAEGCDALTGDNSALLRSIAELATQAIANASSYEQAQRRLAELQALRTIDTAITSSHDEAAILTTCVEQVRARLGVDAAVVLRYDPLTRLMHWGAGEGMRNPCQARLSLPIAHAAASSISGGSQDEAKPLRRMIDLAELRAAGLTEPFALWLADEGFVELYSLPLIANHAVKGLLVVLHRSPLAPSREWLDFFETLAGQIAIAMTHLQLFASLSEANDALVHAYHTTIEGWSRALDLRDKETKGHSQRVTALTLQLAVALGVGEEALVNMRHGALLHDIGKMGVPDYILLKPGPLDEAEWAIMKRHPMYAYELLEPIPYLRPALDIPFCHHEKWDGTGYPQGLSGKQIPLAARIFAVVDVWDALTSDRPYRSAWSPPRALAHIVAASGRHFDPTIVMAFVRLIRAPERLKEVAVHERAQPIEPLRPDS